MSARSITMTALLACLAVSPAFAEEFNPVIGKSGDFTLRETDLERLVASQPPEIRRQLDEKPELKVNLAKELLLNVAESQDREHEYAHRRQHHREAVVDAPLNHAAQNSVDAGFIHRMRIVVVADGDVRQQL